MNRRESSGTSRPQLHTTTLWHHPTQQYAGKRFGNPAYVGRTPVHVIYNLLERYTQEGDLVLDPFCGGGTTLDVAHELQRNGVGYDIAPSRPDIERADARSLPLEDEVCDFVFMDPPYSTHIKYSGDEACIGELDAFDTGYFEAMAQVFGEAHRVLKDQHYLAVYVSDSFKNKRGFVPIGTHFMVMLAELFVPVDHIAVVRGNKTMDDPRYHKAALEENFYLRGFNHLLIFRKDEGADPDVREDARGAQQDGAPARGGQGRGAQGRPGQGRPGQGRPGQNRSGQHRSGEGGGRKPRRPSAGGGGERREFRGRGKDDRHDRHDGGERRGYGRDRDGYEREERGGQGGYGGRGGGGYGGRGGRGGRDSGGGHDGRGGRGGHGGHGGRRGRDDDRGGDRRGRERRDWRS